ncbi:hypothetical protein [Nostoc flagelliforme]|nr:hypothetical protein [Nostoc flagelliforme]
MLKKTPLLVSKAIAPQSYTRKSSAIADAINRPLQANLFPTPNF